MPAAEGMTHMIPNHVLRVGQTIRLDPTPETAGQHVDCGQHDLDISLENLNRIILELDPTFEPIQVDKSPPADDCCSDEDLHSMLVPRGCSTPSVIPSISPSIPIPMHSSLSWSPPGTLVFSSSPCSSRPPLPYGSVPRRNPSPKSEAALSQGSLRLSQSNRNSVSSLLSMSTCSDTSYILGSNLSLASEDADSPESILIRTSGSFSDGSRTRPFERPSATKQCHPHDIPVKEEQSSPESLSGSLGDIPILLINGVPQPDLGIQKSGPETDLLETISESRSKPCFPQSFQTQFNSTQPTMKFVMDTSKFWFRPHVSRAEAEALVKDKEAGTFVVRDSTSYRGSFGLAMKVDQTSTEQNSSELVKHFLIESSAKGVRVKGSSQEPYFGSLSALVYQHTISAYALPCKLLLHSKAGVSATEGKASDKHTSEDKSRLACNFIYLNAIPTEMLTGPCAVHKAVSSTLQAPASFRATIVNLKVSLKGVTLTDINRKLFFRRHYPAHLLSHSGEDPENRLWAKGSCAGARMFGFVAKGVEAGMENVCHVFAEYDPLQPCSNVIEAVQTAISKTQTQTQ
ncbi:tensin-4 isoform X1 [Takifugu rubripes]|uniref:Tensin 4 n=1 Tax=Takifugu rubripes TaxID=31033 RepID=A0A674P595_TAKRU|nr:tensin-4 isoform X1 [Takifugu rubripes]|eukprot:XP_011610862.1 PREDICTED: tensin-4 isoform X2 [Takifugu rubripes]